MTSVTFVDVSVCEVILPLWKFGTTGTAFTAVGKNRNSQTSRFIINLLLFLRRIDL